MARQVIPSQILYTCDGCNCSGENEIKLNLNGLKKSSSEEVPANPYSLDLCGECVEAFETWLETYKASK